MPSPILIGAAVGVPLIAFTGVGAWWYFQADRVVASGETSGWDWRVRREEGALIPEALAPATPGFARGTEWTTVGAKTWTEVDAAKAVALTYIATQLGGATSFDTGPEAEADAGPAVETGEPPALEIQAVAIEASPVVLTAEPMPAMLQFATGG